MYNSDSDFLRGDHSNPNSPYFVGASEPSDMELEEYVWAHLTVAAMEHFFNNAEESVSLQYEDNELEELPVELQKEIVAHFVDDSREYILSQYYK